MAKVTLSKKIFDTKIEKLLQVQRLRKALGKKEEELKIELESQYILPAQEKEIIQGTDFEMVKVPVNAGRNSYDPEKFQALLKSVRGAYGKVVKVEVVKTRNIDFRALADLVKAGKITEEQLAACRLDNWTFKSQFNRIEVAKNEPKPTKRARKGSKDGSAA